MSALLLAVLLAAQETDPVRLELASEVRKMIDAGPPSSAVIVVGIGGAHHCFSNSAEAVFAVSEALPFLPADLQARAKEYLKKVVAEHPPWTPACWVGPSPWTMYAPQPPSAKEAKRNDVPIVNAYFAMKYAEATGDWASIEKGYGDFKGHFGRIKDAPADYPQTTAAIGFARLAKHFGKDADAVDAEAKAAKGLEAGREYEKVFDATLARNLGGHDWAYPPFTERRKEKVIVTAFAPEIFRMLRESAQEEVRKHSGAVMDAWARTWFLTRPNLPTFYGPNYFKPGVDGAPNFMKKAFKGEQHDFGQENATWTPDVACTFFMIRAYVLGESRAQLLRYMDVPWTRSGDVYHLLKLIALLRAP